MTSEDAQVSKSSAPRYARHSLISAPLSAGSGDHPAGCLAWELNIQARNFLKALRDLNAPSAFILMDDAAELPAALGEVSA